jgi:putative tryptophan/tyrosine transport system substrate-binding protein
MKRRSFLALVACASAWPRAARGQMRSMQTKRTIGVLLLFARNDPEAEARIRAFEAGMRELGWAQGENIQIEYRFAAGNSQRMSTLFDELVTLPVDVIVTNVGHSAGLFKPVTVPIVYAMVHSWSLGPPGLIASLSHPGRNVTGFTNGLEPFIVAKWLEMLRAVAPNVTHVGFMFNPSATSTWENWLRQFKSAATSSSVKPQALPIHGLPETESCLAALGGARSSALIVMPDVFMLAHHADIAALAAHYDLPACYPFRYFTTDGGLMSYGANGAKVSRQAASYVDRILRGARPGELPIQQPNTLELVINLKTAKTMGLNVPPWLLARADEVIE